MSGLTVQDLINRHRDRGTCDYTSVLLSYSNCGGGLWRHSNVSNLVEHGDGRIEFDYVVDVYGHVPEYNHIDTYAMIIERVEDRS